MLSLIYFGLISDIWAKEIPSGGQGGAALCVHVSEKLPAVRYIREKIYCSFK